MELFWWIAIGGVLLALIFLLTPYLRWCEVSRQTLEAHIARTSFHYPPGELVPPSWKVPEVALSVVVPAYNEEYRLPQMLDETLSYLEARVAASPPGFSYEVVVVDDGSTDGTYAAALGSRHRQLPRDRCELRVMQLSANRGKGFAVRAGMLAARGQLLLLADADGATRIRDVEVLEQALDRCGQGGADIAFGSRHHLKGEAIVQRAWYRTVLMMAFHFIVWVLVGGSVRDTQCGFKLFRAGVGKQIFSSLHLYRWAFDIEIVILARHLGRRIAEVPVTWVEMPGSKLNLVSGSLTMLRDIALVRVLYIVGIWRPSVMA